MKRVTSPAFVLFLAICALLISGANQNACARDRYSADEGRIRIRYSPVLGLNIVLAVSIDGYPNGSFAKGHIFSRRLPAGRHVISVYPNGRYRDSGQITLDVRPGYTYDFVAKFNVNRMLLVPVGDSS